MLGRNGTRSVTQQEFKSIVLTVAYAVLNPGMSAFFNLVPIISLLSPWSVKLTYDVDRFADRIKNSQVNNRKQVAKELARLKKHYPPANGGVHKEPMVVVDCCGQILLWYLPEVLITERLVGCNQLPLIDLTVWSDHPQKCCQDDYNASFANMARYLTPKGVNKSWCNMGFRVGQNFATGVQTFNPGGFMQAHEASVI